MNNLIAFTGTFLSYLILFLVFATVVTISVFVGITMRKIKNNNKEAKEMDTAVKES